jgi:MtN3 and saliva related transmembrane protein
MSFVANAIGTAAGICTTFANIPQLKKVWMTGETDDLSIKTLLLLSGLALWVLYGFLQGDWVLVAANAVSLAIAAALTYFKLKLD